MLTLRRFILALALLAVPGFVLAATVGPTSAGTGADDAAVGTLTWTNPGNITASDDTRATLTGNGGAISHYLKGTNFGFSVPAGATINGILVEWETSKSGMGNCNDSTVKIVKADGSIGTTNKGSATNLGTTDAFVSYGGAADVWGETWASTDINDSDFGSVISITFPVVACQAQVDSVRITVTYTAATSGRSGPLLLGVGKPVTYKQTRSARAVTAL